MAAPKKPRGFQKGHTPWNKGIPRREETKRKISEANKGNPPTSGSYQKGNQLWRRRKRAGMPKGHPNPQGFKKGQVPWNKGLTKETDDRVRALGEKGSQTIRAQYAAGKQHWAIGLTKRTDQRIRNLADAKSGIATVWGEKHGNWRGGISRRYNGKPYPSDFDEWLKNEIRKRDDYTCQECGIPQNMLKRKLDVHHIDWDKNNLDPDNLISYCRSCHMKEEWEVQRRLLKSC